MTRDLANAAMDNTGPDNRRALDHAVTSAIADVQNRRPVTSYSRFVALMKLVLPVVAGILILMVVMWPELSENPSRFQLGMARINVGDTDDQTLINARYTGIDGKNNPYSVTADRLIQNAENENFVDLKNPKADVTVGSGSWLAIMSPVGRFEKKEQVLTLKGGVDAFHDLGYEFRTEHAVVNFKAGTANGASPVHGQGPFGELQSQGFKVLESGARIIFTGPAHLLLYPTQKKGAK